MHDHRFIRAYKAWLSRYVNLTDCTYRIEGNRSRLSNVELAEFRAHRTLPYVERDTRRIYRNDFAPRYAELGSHLNAEDDFVIFASQADRIRQRDPEASPSCLLMLLDIDDKPGTGDPQGAAEWIGQKYLNRRTFIEPSTGGRGRHVYILLDIHLDGVDFLAGRADVWSTMRAFARVIREDADFARFGVSLADGFYGMPTVWDGDDVAVRGNELKLPQLRGGQTDLDGLEGLVPLSLAKLRDWLAGKVTTQNVCLITPSPEQPRLIPDSLDAFSRHRAAVDAVLRQTSGRATVEQALSYYHEHGNPTGMSETDINKRRRKLSRILEHRRKTYDPQAHAAHAFRSEEHLKLVEELVPVEALKWDRPEKLTHRKLADFVGLKIADAFHRRGRFGRTTRDQSIINSRTLKSAGTLSWTLNRNSYAKLYQIAKAYKLLDEVEPYIAPRRDFSGRKINDGAARLIGPGEALAGLRFKFRRLYDEHRERREQRSPMHLTA